MSKRLITEIVPKRYVLAYEFKLSDHTYGLSETIDFELMHDSSRLVFHGAGFTVSQVLIDGEEAPQTTVLDAKEQTVTCHYLAPLLAGNHTIELKLHGAVGEDLHGLYRSRYTQNGREQWIVLTQFEAVHAREAFVCIDEPSAKAIFELSVTVPERLTVLSNTDVVREISLDSGNTRHDFAPTPIMSSYLVALVIGDLAHIRATTHHQTLIRVYSTVGNEAQLEFALDTAVRSLEFFEDYFDVPYPISKLDMVAIPDFAAGAMENWGLVTYRETALLLDPAQTSLGNRQRVAEVITHELAHQWFGNLVTMAWWNDLWLNEGFASWMEVFAQDHLFPEWSIWEQFAEGHYAYALERDGLLNSHPVEVEVDDPRELEEIFDAVSYSKGAAIINMIHAYLGAEAFRDGLRAYIKAHSYSNTVTNDLWGALERASGRPVVGVMNDWTSRAGYPLITHRGQALTQTRFLNSGRVPDGRTYEWSVPVSVMTASGQTVWEPLLKTKAGSFSHTDWIKLNPGQTGYYRVLYDGEALERVLPAITSGSLEVVDRFGIINDLFATTEAGLTSSAEALRLLESLRGETSYVAAMALRSGFDSLLAVVESSELRRRLIRFGAWLNQPNYDRLGWEPKLSDTYFDQLLRPVVLQIAVRSADTDAIAEAHERYESSKNGATILPDIRPVLYYAAARYGDGETFDELLTRYKQEKVPQERMRLLGGLCRFQQPEIIQRALALGISGDVRSQDTIFVMAWSFLNREARELTWEFLKAHWALFIERYGDGGMMLDSFPQYAGMAFATEKSAGEVEEFFARHPHPSITRPSAQAVESIRIRAAWYKRDRRVIEDFLNGWEERHSIITNPS